MLHQQLHLGATIVIIGTEHDRHPRALGQAVGWPNQIAS